MITVLHYLVVSFMLFGIGVLGVLLRRNLLILLMSVELMLNGGNLALIAFSRAHGESSGQGIAVFVITVAAAEAAVGLALVLALFRHRGKVNADEFRELKG